MPRNTQVLTVSLPPDIIKQVDAVCAQDLKRWKNRSNTVAALLEIGIREL
jgi:metal-responsive CopG/Arc/MetJ family transcriptional regulator